MIRGGKLVGKVAFVDKKDDYIAVTVTQNRKNVDFNDKSKTFDEKFESWKVYVRGDVEIEPKKYYDFNNVTVGISARNGKPFVSVQAEDVKEHIFDNNGKYNNNGYNKGYSSNNRGNYSNYKK
jgi:hypothetical protein